MILACAVVTLCAVAAGNDVFEGADWIRDPVFAGMPVVNTFHREKQPAPEYAGPANVHTLFRKEITLREKPAQVVLYITGDDYYKFYVNDTFVVQGPEAGYPASYPYYFLDVTEFFQAGVNCLASHAYYQGLLNRVWVSADNRSGFMLALEATYPDGSKERFVTDKTWGCWQLQAFPTGEIIGSKTQFAENIDMRLIPTGWRQPGFNAANWLEPLCGRQDHVFVKQLTPPLQHEVVQPVSVKQFGKDRFQCDFGREIVGHTRVRIQGKPGQVIKVRHAEEMDGKNKIRYELRAHCKYEEKVTLSGGVDTIEFYDYRGFRYVEIADAPAKPELWVDVRHHPFDASKSALRSSDPALEGIWTICRNGVEMNAQGVFVDCPTREKGQYIGDSVIESRSHLWLTADPSLTRKALRDFQLSSNIHPGLMAVAPSSFMQEIAEYSLQWPLMLREYYRQTGDRASTEALADAAFEGLFAYFARFENADGLLEKMEEKWVLVDWPQNLRDDYDYDYAKVRACTELNAFYYGALRCAAELLRDFGKDGSAYDARAERVARGFAARIADPKTGLYVDAPGSSHASLHANAVPLCFGLTAGADPAKMLELIRQKRLSCGVYIAPYVIEACFRYGAADLAYDLLTSKDEHSWREMLRNGATTCMEAWGPEQKWNTSWCHAWSSSPIYLIAEYVMGLSPAEPGWKKIRVAPAKIAALPRIELTVPIPGGNITVNYAPETGYTVRVLEGREGDVLAAEGVQVMGKKEVAPKNDGAPASGPDFLVSHGWNEHVGAGRGVWVSVERQRFYVIEQGKVVWEAPCSTAAAGTGSETNSMKTPLGWHHVAGKLGEGAVWGQVFRSRQKTHEVWHAGGNASEDLVLTRVFLLDGDEPGRNKGRNASGVSVDSMERAIYIHGTNAEERIGTPVSHGCIRLRNDDVIKAFELIADGTPVFIL